MIHQGGAQDLVDWETSRDSHPTPGYYDHSDLLPEHLSAPPENVESRSGKIKKGCQE